MIHNGDDGDHDGDDANHDENDGDHDGDDGNDNSNCYNYSKEMPRLQLPYSGLPHKRVHPNKQAGRGNFEFIT